MYQKYYLYMHIRLDKNEPFYIGIGRTSKRHISEDYARAYSKSCRNRYWKNIVNVTNYEVEIIFESDNHDIIKNKEIEFINLYGRKDLGKGTLVNLTEGGEGHEKSKISINKFKETFRDKEWRKILQFDLDGNLVNRYNGTRDLIETTNYNRVPVYKALIGINSNMYNFIWIYEDEFSIQLLNDKINRLNIKNIPIVQFLKDGTVKEWESISDAAKVLKIDRGSITKVCKGQRKTCNGSYWKYKK